MHWKTMFKGNFIAAVEFGEKAPILTIVDVKVCKLEQEDGRQKDKGIIMFEETERGWVLCKTNAMCLAAMFGDDTSQWIGKRVQLYATMVSVGTSKQPGIRVKGSPDITKAVHAEIKLPRKKPFTMIMTPSNARQPAAPQQQTKPASSPPPPAAPKQQQRSADDDPPPDDFYDDQIPPGERAA